MSSPLKTNTDRGEALGFVLCVFTCHLRPNVKNSKLLRWTEEKMCATPLLLQLTCISACLRMCVSGGFGSNERQSSRVCVPRQGMKNPGRTQLCFPQYFHIGVSPFSFCPRTHKHGESPPHTESRFYDLRSGVRTLHLSLDPEIPHLSL